MFRFVVIAVTSLMASGCADVLKSSRVNPQTIAVYPGGEARSVLRNRGPGGCPFTKAIGDSNRGAINLDCFRFPEDAGTTNPPAYDRAAQAGSNDRTTGQAKFYRNRLGAVLMKQADDVCTLEKGRMVRTESGGNFLFSLLTTGLSTSSTIVAGERAKTILSALATASNATQDNFNSSFYKNQLIQAISKSMDEARATKAATINGKLLSGPAEYTVDQMIFEINQYHQACSFEHGLQRLLDAAVDANGARATLRSLSSAATLRALEDRKAQLIADLQNAAITEKEGILADLKQVNAKMTEIVLSEAEIRAERPSAVVPAPATTSTGK